MFRLLIISILFVGCSSSKKEGQSAITLSDISISDLNGNSIDLSDKEGKVVFVNFWATWCRPCLEEMPSIVHLQEQLSNKPIEFYFASDEEMQRIQSFIEKRNMKGNFVRLENTEALGLQALPTTFIFNKKGDLVYSEMGYQMWDSPAMIEKMNQYINENE